MIKKKIKYYRVTGKMPNLNGDVNTEVKAYSVKQAKLKVFFQFKQKGEFKEMEIELVNPATPKLASQYRAYVHSFILNKNITLEEWNSRFKNFRDDYGYSIIHYLESVVNRLDMFITLNPIMIENKEELEKRFGVKIRTPEEMLKEEKQNE